jgi:hypothetical protein
VASGSIALLADGLFLRRVEVMSGAATRTRGHMFEDGPLVIAAGLPAGGHGPGARPACAVASSRLR